MARIQPICRADNILLGYYDGTRVFPRSVTERNIALKLHNNHFCLIWISEGFSFNQAITELKDSYKINDIYRTEQKVNSHFKYEFIPQKIESHLTNFIVNDLETHNTVIARPYVFCFYRLSKKAGRYNSDLTRDEIDKCKKDTIAFDGDNCVEKVLDFCLKLKVEQRKVKKKTVEYNFQLHAHNGSRFDTWMILNNLPCDIHIVDIIKNGKDIISLRIFNGYIEKNKKNFLNV